MYRFFMSGVLLAGTLSFVAAAQEAPAEDPATTEAPAAETPAKKPGSKSRFKPAKPGADKDGATAAPPAERRVLPPPKGGDKIFMKGGTGTPGSVLTGVQVIRSTPLNFEVELLEGEPPLLIPRKQVDHVEYDDIDPIRDRLRAQMFPEAEEVTIASGERVTGALRDKLEAPVSGEPLSYKNQDFIRVLDEVKTKTGANLKIDPSIEAKTPAQRRWTVEIPPEKNLMALLREDLVGAFNFVEVIFETDGILVMTKEAANKRAAEAAAAAAEAPAAEPAPGAATDEAPTPAGKP